MTSENQHKTHDLQVVETKAKTGRPKKVRVELDVGGIADESFADAVAEHERLVVFARQTYERLLRAGDAETGRMQVTYNQSLKTLVALQKELERRSEVARDTIRAVEAREAMLRLAGLIVERLDALGSECGENCNAKDPIKAIGVLTDWARDAREKVARVAGVFEAPSA